MSERALSAEQLRAAQERDRRDGLTAAQLTGMDIDRMTGDEYRDRLRQDKDFADRVNAIEANRPQKPR